MLGIRLASNFVRFGLPFPPFSDDPIEQWLVSEALLARYHREVGRAEELEQQRQQAADQGQQLLQETLEARRLGGDS